MHIHYHIGNLRLPRRCMVMIVHSFISHFLIILLFSSPSFRDWEMHIHFRIGNLMSPKELYGDGLAIWLTKDRMVHGSVFGSIDYFQGLGIFLDTYRWVHV